MSIDINTIRKGLDITKHILSDSDSRKLLDTHKILKLDLA